LVDNGSTDGSVELVRKSYPWVKVLQNRQNLGFSRGNNQGIKACDADYYLLLNTDTEIYTQDWLTNLLKPFDKDKSFGIVTCSQPSSKNDLQQAIERQHDALKEVSFAPGSVMLIRKETIHSIGLMEEEFTPAYYEDTDWCYRALSAGWKIVYDPSTIIFHYRGRTNEKIFAEIPRYFHLCVRNRIMFVLMNHPLRAFPNDLILELKSLASAIFKGTRWERKQKLQSLFKAYSEVCFRGKRLIHKRRIRRLLRKDRTKLTHNL
jgi:GT2 family glycosyltransferase